MKISKRNDETARKILKTFGVGPAWFSPIAEAIATQLQRRDDKIAELKTLRVDTQKHVA